MNQMIEDTLIEAIKQFNLDKPQLCIYGSEYAIKKLEEEINKDILEDINRYYTYTTIKNKLNVETTILKRTRRLNS